MLCEFLRPRHVITIDGRARLSSHSTAVIRQSRISPYLECPLVDIQTVYTRRFFNEFLPRNSITGKRSSPVQLLGDQLSAADGPGRIVCAIGALQTAKSRSNPIHNSTLDALQQYESAVSSLRFRIEEAGYSDLVLLSWSTLLLGLFEVSFILGTVDDS